MGFAPIFPSVPGFNNTDACLLPLGLAEPGDLVLVIKADGSGTFSARVSELGAPAVVCLGDGKRYRFVPTVGDSGAITGEWQAA